MATRISSSYLLKRITASLFVIWGIMTINFFLLKALPGDYVSTLTNNPQLSGEQIAAIRAQFGLTEPLYVQYLKFLQNYATLNFGWSLQQVRPVIDLIAYRLPRTLVLFGTAILLQFSIGILAGAHFGWKRGSNSDKAGFTTGLTMYSVPFFWLGWLLLLVFAHEGFGLTLFPTGQMTESFVSAFGALGMVSTLLWHLVLPVASLTVIGWGANMLVMRTTMQEVLSNQYIETARAKGLAPTVIKYKHAARNALIPVTTQSIVALAFLLDGSIVVETVFNWPGMGLLLITAIQNNNFPVAMAAFFMLGVVIVILRFVTDILYTYLDPRIKFGEEA